jgi:D-sedoheptulose 7-phosphate isomerase
MASYLWCLMFTKDCQHEDAVETCKGLCMNFFQEYLQIFAQHVIDADHDDLERAFELISSTRQRDGKVIVVGNGGSAAMASHVSIDLTKAAGVRAINFNEADLLTCFANDYGYEYWVEKALDFYADKPDLLIAISSSGRSPNILNGVAKAKKMGMPVITLSGFAQDNPLRGLGDVNFWVNSSAYNIVEMTHHVWLLALVDRVVGPIEHIRQ